MSDFPFDREHTRELLQFFAFTHLPERLQVVSKPFGVAADALFSLSITDLVGAATHDHSHLAARLFYDLIQEMESALPANSQATRAITKLAQAQDVAAHGSIAAVLHLVLEAKDCAVRAILFKAPETSSREAVDESVRELPEKF